MKLTPYFRFQLGFWILFPAFYSLKEQTLIASWQIGQFLIFALSGITVTHLYRQILNKKHFPYRNFWSVLMAIFLPVVSLGVVVMVYDFYVDMLYYKIGFYNQPAYTLTLASYFADGCIIFLPWFLLFHLYKYGKKVGELGRDHERQQLALHHAQLQLVINKLNPHFLFNTFNTIRWLINRDTEKARDAIDSLAEIMRYSTRQNISATTTLQEELDIVKKYLSIEKLRFEENLAFSVTCSSELMERRIIPFLILNTVENAVKHGVGKHDIQSHVYVKIYDGLDALLIEVVNPGSLDNQTQGFGLASVQSLLAQEFGSASNIKMKEENGLVYTTINIHYA